MISAVVHTYNEEKNLERCLSSLQWTDEIVVIDMGSTDKTLEIAKEYKAHVFQHHFTNFVEPARNFGIEKANGDWVLILDADEEMPLGLSRFLKKSTGRESYDYYRIARKNIIFGKWMKHSGWWPDYQIRFFKKGTVKWVEKIHGIPLTSGSGSDIEAFEDLSIIHHSYQSLEQYVLRMNRYTGIVAKEYFLSNNKFAYSKLFQYPLKEFITRFFVWQGYLDGLHGLGLSFLQSFSEFVTLLKVWELEGFKEEKIHLKDIETEFANEFKEKQFWLYHELLKGKHPWGYKIWMKFKRKFHIYG